VQHARFASSRHDCRLYRSDLLSDQLMTPNAVSRGAVPDDQMMPRFSLFFVNPRLGWPRRLWGSEMPDFAVDLHLRLRRPPRACFAER
jgi:hypothetical protein